MASNRVPPVGGTTASTSSAGIVQLTDSTSSTSTTTAATPNSVKSAYDLANGAIAKTLTTTTGDIIYASGANTPARLGIGSTDQVLKVSGGVPVWGSNTVNGFLVEPLAQYVNVSNNTTFSIPFDASDYMDTDNFHDTVTNNTRVTIPSGLGGKYWISFGVQWNGVASNNTIVDGMVYRNNGLAFMERYTHLSTAQNINLNGSQIMDLSAGDYLEVRIYQNSGSTVGFWGRNNSGGRSTFLSGYRIGA